LTHNPDVGEGVTLVVVTVAALAFGLLRVMFFPPFIKYFLLYPYNGLSISEARWQKNTRNNSSFIYGLKCFLEGTQAAVLPYYLLHSSITNK
jgi:hypothetical protein